MFLFFLPFDSNEWDVSPIHSRHDYPLPTRRYSYSSQILKNFIHIQTILLTIDLTIGKKKRITYPSFLSIWPRFWICDKDHLYKRALLQRFLIKVYVNIFCPNKRNLLIQRKYSINILDTNKIINPIFEYFTKIKYKVKTLIVKKSCEELFRTNCIKNDNFCS